MEREKKMVLEEMRVDQNTNYPFFYSESGKILFKGTSLLFDPIGTKKSLKKLNSKIAKETYRKYYTQNNSVIIYVGRESPQEMLKEINKNFKHLEVGEKIKYPEFKLNKNIRENILKTPSHFNFYSLNYFFVFLNRKEKDLLYILRSVLFNKIQENLVYKEKLSYDFRIDKWEFETTGLLDINSSFRRGNKAKILKILSKEISSLKITEKEFLYVRNKIIDELDFTLDNPFELSEYLAFNLIGSEKFRTLKQERDALQEITLSDLKDFAKKVLMKENLSLFISNNG